MNKVGHSRVGGRLTNRIWANSKDELLNILRQIDISVPPRSQGRTKEQCEVNSICKFLSSLVDVLSFPLLIVHEDRPDFVLRLPCGVVGIEVTEVVPERFASVDAYREEKEIDGPFFLKRALLNDKGFSKKALEEEAWSKEPGEPWYGDSVEREWARVMKSSIRKKISVAQKPEFRLFQFNYLLMYDNWHLPAVELPIAAEMLFNSLAPEDYVPFEKTFIESSRYLWTFTLCGYSASSINDLWGEC